MFQKLREDIASIIERDPAARNAWEVLTCYPGFQAIGMHRLASWFWRHKMRWLGRFLSHVSRLLTGIEIHPGAIIGRRVFIDHGYGVVIGETAEIGDDCTIYQGVTLGGTSLSQGYKRHPTLEKGVIVGAGAKILGGIVVGEMAKIGSNAVVIKEVPAFATVVGNPARIVLKKEDEDAADAFFPAYGITADNDDPLIKALRELINHADAQEKQLKNVIDALESAGIHLGNLQTPSTIDTEQLNKLVE